MRYVHTAAVTSHAALTRSPRESASHAKALAPMIAIKSHPSHESALPMRMPSLGVCCRQIGPLRERYQPRVPRHLRRGYFLLYHSPTVTASLRRLILLALLAGCSRPAPSPSPTAQPSSA